MRGRLRAVDHLVFFALFLSAVFSLAFYGRINPGGPFFSISTLVVQALLLGIGMGYLILQTRKVRWPVLIYFGLCVIYFMIIVYCMWIGMSQPFARGPIFGW